MSNPHLPPEILDHIIDLLHNEPNALKECCLVSKSRVPRTRKHLFANIQFRAANDLKHWKKAFPDPPNSPAYHTRTLFISRPQDVEKADAEEDGWIWALPCIERSAVDWEGKTSHLVPQILTLPQVSPRGFSPLFAPPGLCPTSP